MSIRIMIDSTADLPASLLEKMSIVPLTIHFGDEEYMDGVTITHKEFYEKLTSGTVLPTTSQATPDAFTRALQPLVDNGDTVIVITLASRLSGTFQSAMIAAESFGDKVYVVDSRSVTIGAGILAQYALSLIAQGMEAKAIFEELMVAREKIRLLACLDTLEYLHRGGRISRTVAIAGGLLSIKPIISVQDGVINMVSKARGTRLANTQLLKDIQSTGGADFNRPYLLGYTGTDDTLLRKFIEASAAYWPDAQNLPCAQIGSVVGTHAGPGAYAVAFFVK